jgi:hypothetical protein
MPLRQSEGEADQKQCPSPVGIDKMFFLLETSDKYSYSIRVKEARCGGAHL